jgi:hypothetical protein
MGVAPHSAFPSPDDGLLFIKKNLPFTSDFSTFRHFGIHSLGPKLIRFMKLIIKNNLSQPKRFQKI